MPESISVRVLAFGSAVDVLGWQSKELRLSPGATVADALAVLGRENPRIEAARERLKFAVNRAYATHATPLSDGDEWAIIPPVSGGAQPAARLVREPIDLAALIREVESPSVGGVAVFLGNVRYETHASGGLKALEYSAYDAMALTEMEKIAAQAMSRFGLHKLLLVHRLGRLAVGETSIAAVAASPHRAEAFDACRFTVEEVKKAVPIFKREIWQHGEATWQDPI